MERERKRGMQCMSASVEECCVDEKEHTQRGMHLMMGEWWSGAAPHSQWETILLTHWCYPSHYDHTEHSTIQPLSVAIMNVVHPIPFSHPLLLTTPAHSSTQHSVEYIIHHIFASCIVHHKSHSMWWSFSSAERVSASGHHSRTHHPHHRCTAILFHTSLLQPMIDLFHQVSTTTPHTIVCSLFFSTTSTHHQLSFNSFYCYLHVFILLFILFIILAMKQQFASILQLQSALNRTKKNKEWV